MLVNYKNRRDDVVVRASGSWSVDPNPLVESYQKTLKNGIYGFPTWRLAFRGGCGEQPGKFACVFGQRQRHVAHACMLVPSTFSIFPFLTSV